MQLLVSVASASEAAAALEGGADIIDAKDPLSGPLGPVSLSVLREIHAACAGERPMTAALGDASDETAVEDTARAFSSSGAAFVKVGFAGIANVGRIESLIAAAVRGASAGSDGRSRVVAVAYADANRVASLPPAALATTAARAGAAGVLIDTADKRGPGVRALVSPEALVAWIADAHHEGLFIAVAGQLTAEDLAFVRSAGADIAGVRGAACEGGRAGRVSIERVRELRAACSPGPPSAVLISS